MTHDYSEDTAPRWTSIDTRRVVPSAELELLGHARSASHVLGRLVVEAPAVLHGMRDAMAGQPRAASAERVPSPVPWCWDHERTIVDCRRADELCEGEVLAGPADPTGTAAAGGDLADRHYRDFKRRLQAVARMVAELDALAAMYPANALTDESQPAGPGPKHCRLCWADGQRMKEIETDSKGNPFYKGLCRRCGRWRAILGGYADPPQWFIVRLNRGDNITAGIEAKARAQMLASAPKKTKAKKTKGKAASLVMIKKPT